MPLPKSQAGLNELDLDELLSNVVQEQNHIDVDVAVETNGQGGSSSPTNGE